LFIGLDFGTKKLELVNRWIAMDVFDFQAMELRAIWQPKPTPTLLPRYGTVPV